MMEGLETHYVENFPNYKNGTKHKNHRCLSKFRKHIYLAAVQKDYIKKSLKMHKKWLPQQEIYLI